MLRAPCVASGRVQVAAGRVPELDAELLNERNDHVRLRLAVGPVREDGVAVGLSIGRVGRRDFGRLRRVDARRNVQLRTRWTAWRVAADAVPVHEVVGGLLARQVTLARELAHNPGTWNPHVAPLFLRVMADAHIVLAWILEDPGERSRAFIRYGLGQEKLEIEHMKLEASESTREDLEQTIQAREAWLSSQRYPWLTEVNVGAMGDTTTRDMAEATGCRHLHTRVFQPFSAAVHNTWPHVARLNLRRCETALHRPHGIPHSPEFKPNVMYFYQALQLVEGSFSLFDEKTGITVAESSPLAFFETTMDSAAAREAEKPPPEASA